VAARSAGLVPLSYAEYVLRATASTAATGIAPASSDAAAAAAAAAMEVGGAAAGGAAASAPSRTTSAILGELAPLVPADACRFIVCVSAMEGRFFRSKMPTHPHTNMAKAALNSEHCCQTPETCASHFVNVFTLLVCIVAVMVRTSAADYAKE
jgi:streptogramin lyase